ncbi:hypothetical protein BaRGS_00020272 [Batillaria attramentaria]|uniref:NAD kinase 2, mitochondrial n=1 Tax=Batillaria attramentaria TaxID=370345 RepID=A0ABD0KNJ0_9CAEN
MCVCQTTTADQSDDAAPVFRPRKVAVLTKVTRYEYERRRHSWLSEKEFREYLEAKDSDYEGLLQRHNNHKATVEAVKKILEAEGIETKIVKRFEFTTNIIDWADAVFTAGGDGTYLLAASKFINSDKPLIGLNTDPDKSEGHLCLPKRKYPAVNFAAALKRMLDGDFRWKWLQRIQVTMSGQHANDEPVELHNQQLQFPEHRYVEHIAESEQERHPVNITSNTPPKRVLPVLALNEVFVGESLSSRVSYYEFSVDDGPREKQKSSGITICTGTGSSSWHFHINHLPVASVRDILRIASQKTGCQFPVDDLRTMESITNEFNSSLGFDPSTPLMAYTVRDPVVNGIFQVSNPRNFAKQIRIRSRMWDACLVIDGGVSFKFNDGAVATFEIAKNNAIRTVVFD